MPQTLGCTCCSCTVTNPDTYETDTGPGLACKVNNTFFWCILKTFLDQYSAFVRHASFLYCIPWIQAKCFVHSQQMQYFLSHRNTPLFTDARLYLLLQYITIQCIIMVMTLLLPIWLVITLFDPGMNFLTIECGSVECWINIAYIY